MSASSNSFKWLASAGLVAAFAACAGPVDTRESESTRRVGEGQIIHGNLVSVVMDGANIPSKYRPLVDAFGIISVGCTGTHVGGGVVLTAGHCFSAPTTRTNNRACPANTTVAWGKRTDKAAYLTSTCTTILAEQLDANAGIDYAIFRVSPAPPVKVDVDLGARPNDGTTLTIFGFPQLRPLEWSQTCRLTASSSTNQFEHDCDTEPGSSGSTILGDATLKVVGIHDGASGSLNYGTYLAATPIADFITTMPVPLCDGTVQPPNCRACLPADCLGASPYCATSGSKGGQCVTCGSDADCRDPAKPKCDTPTNTCVAVVGPPDGGTHDSGASGNDSGTSGNDSGASGNDSGSGRHDGGSGGHDSGSLGGDSGHADGDDAGSAGESSGGWGTGQSGGCAAARSRTPNGLAAITLLACALVAARARRRRSDGT